MTAPPSRQERYLVLLSFSDFLRIAPMHKEQGRSRARQLPSPQQVTYLGFWSAIVFGRISSRL